MGESLGGTSIYISCGYKATENRQSQKAVTEVIVPDPLQMLAEEKANSSGASSPPKLSLLSEKGALETPGVASDCQRQLCMSIAVLSRDLLNNGGG